MNQKTLGMILAIFLIGAAGYFALTKNPNGGQTPTGVNNPNTKVYVDDRIQVAVPTDWSYTPSTASQWLISVAKAAENPDDWSSAPATQETTGDAVFKFPVGVTLIKEGYILSLITHASQASGIKGGRLDEIAGIALSLPVGQLSTGCNALIENSTKVTDSLKRVDMYFDVDHATAEEKRACDFSGGQGIVYYGSYFSQSDNGGYFIDYSYFAGTDRIFNGNLRGQMAFGLKVKAKSSEYLPGKGDPKLEQMLKDASDVVANISYEQEAIQKPDIIKNISGTDRWITTGGDTQWIASCDDATLDWNKITAAYQGKIYLNVIEMSLDKYPTTVANVDALHEKIGAIATDNEWQKCNSIKGTSICSLAAANAGKCTLGQAMGEESVDVYKKGNDLMNIKKGYYPNGLNLISVDFGKEGDYVPQVKAVKP